MFCAMTSFSLGCGATDDDDVSCLEACDDACPAPELQPCATNGERYCNTCVMACNGLEEAEDPSVCDDEDALQVCLETCGAGCPAPEFQLCATNGERYCNTCTIACHGLEEADDPSVCDDEDALQVCLESCGAGCPAPEFQPCATDGERYCNTCTMACYGLDEADDPSVCDASVPTCDPRTDGDAIPFRAFVFPEDCIERLDVHESDAVYDSAASFFEDHDCDGEPDLGVDFDTERLVRAVMMDNPAGAVIAVREVDEDVVIQITAPRYCGGAAPPNTSAYIVAESEFSTFVSNPCLSGICDDGGFPPPK